MASIPKPALAEPVVQLYRNVVERLNRDVRKTFEANPPQGAEVGGLLLGTANQQAGSIHVQDFEPLSGEARTDGRFIVTGAERDKLENTLRQCSGELIVVGCYRSHMGETPDAWRRRYRSCASLPTRYRGPVLAHSAFP